MVLVGCGGAQDNPPLPARSSGPVLLQLLEQYAEQVQWQSEIRHEAIRFPPMEKMIVDYQVSAHEGEREMQRYCCRAMLLVTCSLVGADEEEAGG